MKVSSKKGSGLKDLLQAAAEGQRHFSIKFDSRFEVSGLPHPAMLSLRHAGTLHVVLAFRHISSVQGIIFAAQQALACQAYALLTRLRGRQCWQGCQTGKLGRRTLKAWSNGPPSDATELGSPKHLGRCPQPKTDVSGHQQQLWVCM